MISGHAAGTRGWVPRFPVFRLLSLPLIAVFSWLAEFLLPVFHRGKHAHPARAVHDPA
jgi:hypothetical protein